MKYQKRRHYSLEDDPKYKRAQCEFEALRTTGSTDALVFSPLLRSAKQPEASPATEARHGPGVPVTPQAKRGVK